MTTPYPRILAVGAALLAATTASSARAEYVENAMGRDLAALTLGVAGTAALAFDLGSAVYLAQGQDRRKGRLITGVGSMIAGALLLAGGLFSLTVMGQEHVPAGADTGPEQEALEVGRVLAGIGVGLGVTSVGIGIASVATFRGTDGAVQQATPPVAWPAPGMRGIRLSVAF